LCEERFVLDGTHSHVDVETVWLVSLRFCYFTNFSFDKIIFSIFQVERDREKWLTASVRHSFRGMWWQTYTTCQA